MAFFLVQKNVWFEIYTKCYLLFHYNCIIIAKSVFSIFKLHNSMNQFFINIICVILGCFASLLKGLCLLTMYALRHVLNQQDWILQVCALIYLLYARICICFHNGDFLLSSCCLCLVLMYLIIDCSKTWSFITFVFYGTLLFKNKQTSHNIIH